MKRYIKVFMVLALAVVICLPATAFATVANIDDAFITNSWGQKWQEDSVGNFNAIEAFIMSPDSSEFEAPGLRNFNTSGWTSGDPNPKYAFAINSGEITVTQFDTIFTGSNTVGLTMDLFAWDGGIMGTLKDYARIVRTSGGWSITANVHDPTGVDYDRSAVPLPPSLLLLGSGLMGMGFLRRKVKSDLAA